ncbi:MAG: hypothetical protein II453_19705 [Alphaproteobacteria bacterium]|nr:hypothetical protein [Alphaproteobacteria bacterium]
MVNIIPRWRIKFKYSDGSIENVKLYGEDKQTMYDKWSKNFEVISVEQDTDTSYIDYINQIKNGSELIAQNSKKQIYKYPHNDSFILVKLYTDGEEYYDYCEYQRWDCRGLMNPISWALSNPKEFCEWFGRPTVELPQGFVVTPKEIRKMKAKRFYNKEGEILWVDDLGYIYSAEKVAMPNKINKAEWEKFHDNPNAVLVSYVLATPDNIYGKAEIKWFENKEAFLQFYQSEKAKVLPYAASPRYEIKRIGYKKPKPEDRKVILRLPYINLDGELAYGTPAEDIALSWSRMCDRKWQGSTFDCYSLLIDVVKHYKERINK